MMNGLNRFVYALKHSCRTLRLNIRRNTFLLTNFQRNYSSALYISGKKAHKVFALLSPYLDFDDRFADVDKLQKELIMRQMDTDVIALKKAWEFYKKMDIDKCALEDGNTKLTAHLKTLMEIVEPTTEEEQEMIKLRTQLKIIREDLKVIKEAIWELDESVIERVLKLPNELDSRTSEDPVILRSVGNMPDLSEKNSKNHIDIGINLGLLEYTNPIQYYLCNEAAMFELAVLTYISRVLGDNDMIRVAGTDFGRGLIVEGSGLNPEDPLAAFVIENHGEVERGSPNRMHLVGGASLISFLALHTKQLIGPKNFPLKYFATGRQYIPLPHDVQPLGLFTACQASAAHAFIVVKESNSEEYKNLFEELLESVCQIYNDLCDHYRVVLRSASEVQPWESLRISFEMWSPFTHQYIEIGYLSMCGNYFSKRLLIAYQTPTGRNFPAIISGTILSVPRLLACILEQNPNKFMIPPKVNEYMPV